MNEGEEEDDAPEDSEDSSADEKPPLEDKSWRDKEEPVSTRTGWNLNIKKSNHL